MKEKILALRSQGLTYDAIKKELGCAKSTIAYHCGEGQKEKGRIRTARNRGNFRVAIRKRIDNYARAKVRNFKNQCGRSHTVSNFNYASAYKIILDTKNCYLSGRPIDIYSTGSYNLDHVIPVAKGGRNDLSNMGVACREANMAKTDMTVDEFVALCKDVLINFGYEVKLSCGVKA